ncbi:hypothetical protein HCUR_01282 [Holospora curviuscula]|uniref:Uncharacterized protein n=1 Tax=Holospora curviuscula TaxID=1082868 RepID=A0A2S5R820_9PROT|nr:hypothetical protein HCUR_01282 [Holospora curviuscula]
MTLPRFSGILVSTLSSSQQVNTSTELVHNLMSSKVELIQAHRVFGLLLALQLFFFRNKASLLQNTREFLTYHEQFHVHQLFWLIYHAFGTIQIFFLDPTLDFL